MQRVLEIAALPQSGLDAGAAFTRLHLSAAVELLEKTDTSTDTGALAIVLPAAGPDHDDWRRALARDLARAHAPKRVNIVGASTSKAAKPLLGYLKGAPGVTGQYLAAHE